MAATNKAVSGGNGKRRRNSQMHYSAYFVLERFQLFTKRDYHDRKLTLMDEILRPGVIEFIPDTTHAEAF